MMYEEKKRHIDGVVCSIIVENCSIDFSDTLEHVLTLNYGRGIFRIYKDVPRIEFKEFDGRVYGFPLDLVRTYNFKPVPKYDVPEQFNVER